MMAAPILSPLPAARSPPFISLWALGVVTSELEDAACIPPAEKVTEAVLRRR